MALMGKEDELLAKLQKCVGKIDMPTTNENRRPTQAYFAHQQSTLNEQHQSQKRGYENFENPRYKENVTRKQRQNKVMPLSDNTNIERSYASQRERQWQAPQEEKPSYEREYKRSENEEDYQPGKVHKRDFEYQGNERRKPSGNIEGPRKDKYFHAEESEYKYEKRNTRRPLGNLDSDINNRSVQLEARTKYDDKYPTNYEIPRKRSREREEPTQLYKGGTRRTSISGIKPETSSKYLEASYSINAEKSSNDRNQRKWREDIQVAKNKPEVEERRPIRQNKEDRYSRYSNENDFSRDPITPNKSQTRFSSASKLDSFQSSSAFKLLNSEADQRDNNKARPSIGSISKRNTDVYSSYSSLLKINQFEGEREAPKPEYILGRQNEQNKLSQPMKQRSERSMQECKKSLNLSRRSAKNPLEDCNFNDQDTFQKLKRISELNQNINKRIKNIIDTFENK